MAELMLVMLIGLIGPLLAMPRRFAVPVAVGEILAGVVFGKTGLKVIDTSQPNLAMISQIGFALVMMVAASHIDVRRIFGQKSTGKAAVNVIAIAGVGTLAAYGIATWTGNLANFGIYAVIMGSSSAAVVLPSFTRVNTSAQKPSAAASASNSSMGMAIFIAQVTLADLVAIILLPLVSKAANSGRVAIGAAAISLAAVAIYFLLRWAQSSGVWKRTRKMSADHGFGLELRFSLILLLALIWLAQSFAVTIMIAGFGLGLAIAANGFPRRLAKQVFAVSEGLFSPVYFVLLGAGIDVNAVFQNQGLLALALMLGGGAMLAHLVPVALGMDPLLALASAAQLGVPAAAVSIGLSTGTLTSGQAGAIMLGALMTLAATAIAAAARNQRSKN